MYDLLDVLHGKGAQTLTGTYYEYRPTTISDGGGYFAYEMVDPTEWHYQKLIGNLVNTDGATTTVRSCDLDCVKVGQYVVLQDDRLYKIVSVVKDFSTASREIFRYLKDVPTIEYVLRLVEVDNPWEIE